MTRTFTAARWYSRWWRPSTRANLETLWHRRSPPKQSYWRKLKRLHCILFLITRRSNAYRGARHSCSRLSRIQSPFSCGKWVEDGLSTYDSTMSLIQGDKLFHTCKMISSRMNWIIELFYNAHISGTGYVHKGIHYVESIFIFPLYKVFVHQPWSKFEECLPSVYPYENVTIRSRGCRHCVSGLDREWGGCPLRHHRYACTVWPAAFRSFFVHRWQVKWHVNEIVRVVFYTNHIPSYPLWGYLNLFDMISKFWLWYESSYVRVLT